MARQPEETEVTAPRSRKAEKGENRVGRVVGSKWHYALVLVFAALLSMGIWSRPDWLTLTINTVLILSLAGAGLAMCYAMTRVSKNRMLALLIAVVYMAMPYVLNNLYVRMSLGEMVVLVAAPILLLGLYQLTAREKHAPRSLAVAMALLIVSHSVFAVILALMTVVYVLINVDRVLSLKCVWRVVLAVAVTVGLTAFFTVPLAEAWLDGESETFSQEYVEEYFVMRAVSADEMNEQKVRPQELVELDFASGDYGVALGVMAMIGILGFWFAWRGVEDRLERRFVTSLYVVGIVAIVLAMMNWGVLPEVVWKVGGAWRLLLVAELTLSVVAGYTVFALVQRMLAEKQAVFAIVMGMLAVWLVGVIIRPGGEVDMESLEQVEATLMAVWFWVKCTLAEVWNEVRAGFDFAEPAEIGMLVSLVTAGLGVVWVVVSGVRDWYKGRKQKEVNSLIDSVWEAMAENEGVASDTLRSGATESAEKPKRTRSVRQKTAVLPEPPAPEVPGLETKPVKKSTRGRAKKAEADGAGEASAKKTTPRKTATRKSTAKVKSVKTEDTPAKAAKTKEEENEGGVKPRVTKVKAGVKKEV